MAWITTTVHHTKVNRLHGIEAFKLLPRDRLKNHPRAEMTPLQPVGCFAYGLLGVDKRIRAGNVRHHYLRTARYVSRKNGCQEPRLQVGAAAGCVANGEGDGLARE